MCFERAFFGSGRIYIVGSDDTIFNSAPSIRANSARLYGPASVRESFRPQDVELDLAVEQIAGFKTIIHAEITNRSAIQLKLKKGLSLYALIKALAIISPAV